VSAYVPPLPVSKSDDPSTAFKTNVSFEKITGKLTA